jgi:hypothetical protein
MHYTGDWTATDSKNKKWNGRVTDAILDFPARRIRVEYHDNGWDGAAKGTISTDGGEVAVRWMETSGKGMELQGSARLKIVFHGDGRFTLEGPWDLAKPVDGGNWLIELRPTVEVR